MENIIIIAILVLLVFNGVRSSLKHFKGEGGCCGGDEKVKRKKLKNIVAEKVDMRHIQRWSRRRIWVTILT